MKVWSLYTHDFKRRQMYVSYGRAMVAAIRVMLQAAHQPANAVVPEDDIAASLRMWLIYDSAWTSYLARKSHMTGRKVQVMTDTMARFIASDAYKDITR
jgi:hypothetical protein